MDLNMMGGSMNNLGGTGLSVDNIIEGDLMQSSVARCLAVQALVQPADLRHGHLSLSGPERGYCNWRHERVHDKCWRDDPRASSSQRLTGRFKPRERPHAIQKLYLRKEQKREEARSHGRTQSVKGPNPLEEDIRAITAINAAAAGVPMIPTEEMRPVFARRTDRPRGLAHSVDFTTPGLAYGANVDEGMLSSKWQPRRGTTLLT